MKHGKSKPQLKTRLLKVISAREFRAQMAQWEREDQLFWTLRVIACWPDLTFTSRDGRRFGLFWDGESILLRLEAKHELITPKEQERLPKMAGFILELSGDGNEPMVYADMHGLACAWIELHQLHGTKLTQDELEWVWDFAEVEFSEEENESFEDSENDD